MATRRMFSDSVTERDAFFDLTHSAQTLYFHLAMNADDDGLVDNPKQIQRSTHVKKKDFLMLIERGYVIDFESGIVAIAHWKVNNMIRKDRYKPTFYLKEKSLLRETATGVYEKITPEEACADESVTKPQPIDNRVDNQMAPQYSLGEVSLGQDRLGEVSLVEVSSVEPSAVTGAYPYGAAGKNENKNTQENTNTSLFLRFADQTVYCPSPRDLEQWQSRYPMLNLQTEFSDMQVWLCNNTYKQNSRTADRFVERWLSGSAKDPKRQPAPSNPDYDAFFEAACLHNRVERED